MTERLDHHAGLDYPGLRDLAADSGRPAHSGLYFSNAAYRRSLVDRIESAKRDLRTYDEGAAFRVVLDKFGWDTFDVSDAVDCYHPDTYRCFVGTRDEVLAQYPGIDLPDLEEGNE